MARGQPQPGMSQVDFPLENVNSTVWFEQSGCHLEIA